MIGVAPTRTSPQWFERFFGGLYGRVLVRQFKPAATLRQARLIKKVLGLRKGRRVLDCPCGQGRLTIPLAKMGLAMTGVDLTAGFIRRAKAAERALPSGQRKLLRFIRQDMRRIDFEPQFDAAINWFTSFGYFTDRENLAFCRRALRALKPGGQFLVEVLNRSYLLRHLHSGHEETINGVRIVHKPTWDPRTGRLRATWIMSQAGRTERRQTSIRMYTGGEMRELLRAAGFTDIRLFGHSRAGAERFTRHSRRFIALGRRPDDSPPRTRRP